MTDLSDLGGSGPDATSGDAGDAANLVTNAGFEQGAGGCGPGWSGYDETMTFATPAHSGVHSCEACAQGAVSSYGLDQYFQIGPGNYYAQAWIANPDGGQSVLSGVVVYVTPQGGTQTPYQGLQVTTGTSWQLSQLTFTLDAGGMADFQVHAFGPPPGACILVDDVSLIAQ